MNKYWSRHNYNQPWCDFLKILCNRKYKNLLILMVFFTTFMVLCSPLYYILHLHRLYSREVFPKTFIRGSSIPQPKCVLPVLPLDNPEITKYIEYFPRIECRRSNGQLEQDWVVVHGSQAAVTEQIKAQYKDVTCQFFDLERKNDFEIRMSHQNKAGLTYEFKNSDFVYATCTGGNQKWRSFLAAPRSNVRSPHKTDPSIQKFNILMSGYDSLSRNMFMRKLPTTFRYLKETLGGIVLEGYNIIGDGTPQALIPMLTGYTETELPETRKRKGSLAHNVNVYPFIWNEFRKNGYFTGYMEDSPKLGTFTYRLKGFNTKPTDFYMRPYFVATERYFSEFPNYCIGALPRHKIMMNYVRNILQYKKQTPKFLFSFHSELSHDNINKIQGADADMEDFFKQLQNSGALNNTVLVVFSDHGHRFASIRETQQGKQEERMPMFLFVFPPSFKSSYPRAYENFKANSHILSTPFDIHATLKDLLTIFSKSDKYFSEPHEKRRRGLSLFRRIFLDRTCKDASIEPHWCACLQWQVVNVTLPSVQKAAVEFVNYLNDHLTNQTHLCAQLSLKNVLWAANLFPSDKILHFRQSADADGFKPDLSDATVMSESTLQLKVETTPGNALFEVSLQHDLRNNKFEFQVPDISRINKYGSQASCVEDNLEHLRKFCFCRNQLSREQT